MKNMVQYSLHDLLSTAVHSELKHADYMARGVSESPASSERSISGDAIVKLCNAFADNDSGVCVDSCRHALHSSFLESSRYDECSLRIKGAVLKAVL